MSLESTGFRHGVAELADSFVARLRAGERPSVEEYAAAHPELADELRALLPTLVLLEQHARLADAPAGHLAKLTDPLPPRSIGDFTILREIGRGGMGIVYEAIEESLGRHVAIKVMSAAGLPSVSHLERFQLEARAAARLHHTNIVPVLSVGEHNGLHFYAMQFIPGQSLDQVIESLKQLRINVAPDTFRDRATGQPLHRIAESLISGSPGKGGTSPTPTAQASANEAEQSPSGSAHAAASNSVLNGTPLPHRQRTSGLQSREYYRNVARLGLQIAEALSYAHSEGILHRDVKPSNLLLDVRGHAWITDFGLAKADDSHGLTQSGDLVGTLRYMGPERLEGQSDHRSDLYGLGATLYELLTLRPICDASGRGKLIEQILHEQPVKPRKCDPAIPRDLETIVLKAVAKEPSQRYRTADELAADLRRFLADVPVLARRATLRERMSKWCRRNPVPASLAAALLLAVAGGFAAVTWQWRQAESARSAERVARLDADDNRRRVDDELRRLREATALVERGKMFSQARRWDDAYQAFSQAIVLREDLSTTWSERGRLHEALGLWEEAAADFRREFEIQPPSQSIHWWSHAVLLQFIGDHEGYLRACANMRERFQGYLGMPPLDALRASCLTPYPQASAPGNVSLIEQAARPNTTDTLISYILGLLHLRAGRAKQAIACCSESIALANGREGAALNYPVLVMAHTELGNVAAARQAWNQAIQARENWLTLLDGSEANEWVVHKGAPAKWSISPSEWLEFEILLREAALRTDRKPPAEGDVRLPLMRARALSALGQPRQAVEVYESALVLAPDDPRLRAELFRTRAYVAASRRDYRRAADQFAAALEIYPRDAALWRFRAQAILQAGDADEFRSLCRGMLAAFHGDADSWSAFHVITSCTHLPDALPDFSALMPLADRSVHAYPGAERFRGAVLVRAGQYEEGLACFHRSAKVHPPMVWDWCFQAIAHARLGNLAEARRCLTSAQQWFQHADQREMPDVDLAVPSWGNWAWHERNDAVRLLAETTQVVADA